MIDNREDYNTVKRALYHAQDHICPICGEEIYMDTLHPNRLIHGNIDHVIPKDLGGLDTVGNFLVTHNLCNSKKSNRSPNGCEMIWLLAVNNKLQVKPDTW